MFDDLLNTLEDRGKGIHAYRECMRAALDNAAKTPETACAHYLLASIAEAFVQRFERMPLTQPDVLEAFAFFTSSAETLSEAMATGDDARKLDALNRVSQRLADHG